MFLICMHKETSKLKQSVLTLVSPVSSISIADNNIHILPDIATVILYEDRKPMEHVLLHPMCILSNLMCACRVGPSRCGAQCKTWVRGPSEQWFRDVIVFSQPCYDRVRAQIYSKALTRELSTFANVREEIRYF